MKSKKYKGLNRRYSSYLVIYDISDNKRRYRVVRILEGFGLRIQESAFECSLCEFKLNELKKKLSRTVAEEDSIRIYDIESTCYDVVASTDVPTLSNNLAVI